MSEPAGASSRRTVSENGISRVIGTLCLGFGLVAAVWFFAQEMWLTTVLGIAALLVTTAICLWYWSMTIELRPEGVFVRQVPVRRLIPWDQIRSVSPVVGDNITGLVYCVGIKLVDGSVQRAFAGQGYGAGNWRVVGAVDKINAERARRSPAA